MPWLLLLCKRTLDALHAQLVVCRGVKVICRQAGAGNAPHGKGLSPEQQAGAVRCQARVGQEDAGRLIGVIPCRPLD